MDLTSKRGLTRILPNILNSQSTLANRTQRPLNSTTVPTGQDLTLILIPGNLQWISRPKGACPEFDCLCAQYIFPLTDLRSQMAHTVRPRLCLDSSSTHTIKYIQSKKACIKMTSKFYLSQIVFAVTVRLHHCVHSGGPLQILQILKHTQHALICALWILQPRLHCRSHDDCEDKRIPARPFAYVPGA